MKIKSIFFLLTLFLFNCEAIFVEDISEDVIILIAPANNTKIINIESVKFNWQEVKDATGYEIQIAKPNFTNAHQILVDSITTNLSYTSSLNTGDYEWRVRALNSNHKSNYTTNSFSLTDGEFEDEIVLLNLPLNSHVSNESLQALSWEELKDTNNYRLQIWQPNIDGVKLVDEVVTTNSYEYEFVSGNYTWQVRGEKATLKTMFSKRTISINLTTSEL